VHQFGHRPHGAVDPDASAREVDVVDRKLAIAAARAVVACLTEGVPLVWDGRSTRAAVVCVPGKMPHVLTRRTPPRQA
jgi:hypothetical protein